eukprot:Skav211550  [mRNA]  locus=scaffold871:220043:224739:- [translate_table: standard]
MARLRTYELLLLRGKALGRRCLALPEEETIRSAALADLERAMVERPKAPEPIVEALGAVARGGRWMAVPTGPVAAHIYAFSGDTNKAVQQLVVVVVVVVAAAAAAAVFYFNQLLQQWPRTAIQLMKDLQLPKHEAARLERRVAKLQAGLDAREADCGDGAGVWRVEDITGISNDTCIYHLRTNPPANPHPFPQSAWHVQVFLGSNVREYTPVSSATAWEDGCLDLLVKTYPDGTVSRFFGTLLTVQEAKDAALQNYAPLEEQSFGGKMERRVC